MQISDELRVVVEAEVERAIANFRKLDQSVSGAEKTTHSLSDAIDKIAGKAMLLSTAVAGSGVAAIKFAGDNEYLKASLEGLLKSTEAANRIFSEWQQSAKATPLSQEDFSVAGKQLLAFNISAEDVTDTLLRLGDVAAGTSRNAGEVGANLIGISEIYGKARVQGRLFAEDINQFQGRGIPIIQALAKQFKTSEENVRAMVAEGKVGFPQLEKAFVTMTSNGGLFEGQMKRLSEQTLGKFSTTMDNARIAAASFGDIMLPMANDIMDAANNIFQGMIDLDEGTKRFILTFGGVVAVAGPTIMAIKGINGALAMLHANPMILGITAAVAGVALLTAAVNAQAHAYEDANAAILRVNDQAAGIISTFAKGNDAKKLDEETTKRLIDLYPELATEIKAYETSAADATKAVKALTEQKILDQATSMVERLKRENEEIGKQAAAYAAASAKKAELDRQNTVLGNAADLKRSAEDIQVFKDSWDDAVRKANTTRERINAQLAGIGKRLGGDYQIVNIPVQLVPTADGGNGKIPPALKKTWQQWFAEIAEIPEKAFTENLGKNETAGMKAGRLYVEGLQRELELSEGLAKTLEETFDVSGVLKDQQEKIQKDLGELFAIDPSLIDKPFTELDASTQKLIVRFKELRTQIQALGFLDELNGLQVKIDSLGKSQEELAVAAYKAKGYTEAQAKVLADLNNEAARKEILQDYTVRLDEMGKSTDELTRKKLVLLGATERELILFDEMVEKAKEANKDNSFDEFFTDAAIRFWEFIDLWDLFDEKATAVLANVSLQLAMVSFDSALTGLNAMGQAIGEGAKGMDALAAGYVAFGQQILDSLPLMFLRAGLQLISDGQWALGLGFIGAAGSSAVIAGYTKGYANSQKADTENAHGNVYGQDGLYAFAQGAAFTNSIVDQPTLFRFASGTGLMGEAGPEAIVPLRRLPSGDLGVQTSGGNGAQAAPVINIINYSGAPVTKSERQNGGAKELEIIIGSLNDKLIQEGRYDNANGARYGLGKRVVRG